MAVQKDAKLNNAKCFEVSMFGKFKFLELLTQPKIHIKDSYWTNHLRV